MSCRTFVIWYFSPRRRGYDLGKMGISDDDFYSRRGKNWLYSRFFYSQFFSGKREKPTIWQFFLPKRKTANFTRNHNTSLLSNYATIIKFGWIGPLQECKRVFSVIHIRPKNKICMFTVTCLEKNGSVGRTQTTEMHILSVFILHQHKFWDYEKES